jgi:uncharacterized membrane protein (UPF0127 family)
MIKNKIYFLLIFIFLLFFLTGCFTFTSFESQQTMENKNENITAVEIGGQVIKVELAESVSQQTIGLANREFLFSDQGMLFVYSDYQYPGFWMKGMLFPLDIIWLRDSKVIGWEKNIPVATTTNLQIYYPPDLVNFVLEVPAGLVDNIGLEAGSEVKYY